MATARNTNGIYNRKVIGEIVTANVTLSFKLFRSLKYNVFSPLSLIYIHAMSRAAAQDEQLKARIMSITMEPFEGLEFAVNESYLHLGMADLLSRLNTTNLSVKNDIMYRKRALVSNKYVTAWQTFYGCRDTPMERQQDINRWIAENSSDTIIPVIYEYLYNRCTDFLLVNCVSFSGHWDLDFNTGGRNVRKFISKTLECTFVETKFQGGRFSMIFIYPDNLDAYRQLFNKLKADVWKLIIEGCLTPADVTFTLPLGVFQSETRFKHLMLLKDFDDISGTKFITQKVYLKITDLGATAAAVTILNLSVTESTIAKVVQDDTIRTVFVIYDTVEEVILFMGPNFNSA